MRTVLEDNAFEAIPGTQVTWIINDEDTIATVSNRQQYPLKWKLNPIWWFQNLAEPDPPEWYKPDSRQSWRVFCWYCRNPLHNMGRYVIGVCDRNNTVEGTAPILITNFSDSENEEIQKKTGWKNSVIKIGRLKLPFYSYEGPLFFNKFSVTFYVGWQWWGFFGFKFVSNKTPTIF